MSAATLTRAVNTAACPAWCDGQCPGWRDDVDGSIYHTSEFKSVAVDSSERPDLDLYVNVAQLEVPGRNNPAEVHMLVGGGLGEDFTLSARTARELAAMLLAAADNADQVTDGVVALPHGSPVEGVQRAQVSARARTRTSVTDRDLLRPSKAATVKARLRHFGRVMYLDAADSWIVKDSTPSISVVWNTDYSTTVPGNYQPFVRWCRIWRYPAVDSLPNVRARTHTTENPTQHRESSKPAPASAYTRAIARPAVSQPTQPTHICPPWCGGTCRPDWDGSVFHCQPTIEINVDRPGDGHPGVSLSRIDDEPGQPGDTSIDLLIGTKAGASLTPGQALAMAELLRAQALTAASTAGVDMPVERLRLGDEFLSPDGWQAVELVDVDGWCCGVPPEPDHAHLVRVATDAHEIDEQAWEYDAGTLVQVRRAVP